MTNVVRTATLTRIGAPLAPGAVQRRLFCIPFAGGGAGAFRAWPKGLPADIEIWAVQLPGREARLREPAFDSIPDIVAAVQPLLQAASELPYAIFGHSMGALLAFELALALELGPQPGPEQVFVSGRRSPDEQDPHPPVHALPEEAFLDELQLRYGAVPEAVRQEPELLALLLPTLRADITAIERYTPSSTRKLRSPVHVYGGTEDRHPTPAQLPGWQRVSEREVRVRTFAGNHFYLTAQQAALLADMAAHWSRSP